MSRMETSVPCGNAQVDQPGRSSAGKCTMSASESADLDDQDGASASSDASMQEAASSDEQPADSDEEESEEELLEPKVLPARGTRGNRMTALVAEEDSADEEFWQQEFFAEEGKDEEYEKSSEGEDEADTDFSESEDEGDEGDEEEERRESRRSSRLKPLKPPGSKPTAAPKQRPPISAEAKAAQAALKAERAAQQVIPGAAPTLRHSTRVRVEEAQQERQRAEKVKPRRPAAKVEYRSLTQEEILAEAARTELDNLRDLEQMVAMEEATKQKAMYKRNKYSGPMIRYHSKRVEGVALSMMEVVNMLPPPHMLPSKAPKPAPALMCVITGKPARYRDPASGHGYADLAAYKELKERWNSERRGKTGKRTKRQRSSSLMQTTQPLASLGAQPVIEIVSGQTPQHAIAEAVATASGAVQAAVEEVQPVLLAPNANAPVDVTAPSLCEQQVSAVQSMPVQPVGATNATSLIGAVGIEAQAVQSDINVGANQTAVHDATNVEKSAASLVPDYAV